MALNKASEKIAQLENAIKRLCFVKKHLSRNASDIKKEIHSCVSRNLECLRGREVALLSQVDEVFGIKEEALHQQEAHLNQALGVLQTGLSMMKDDTASEKQLNDTLQKLNGMELSPGETPHIAFRADHVSLQDSIMKYGRVDANGLSLSAFENPDIPSASLPRHWEDYEDVDHHIFTKPVQKINMADHTTRSITVSIPKLSNRMEDWLQKRDPPTKLSVASSVLPMTKLNSSLSRQPAAVRCVTEPAKSSCSTPSDACSLNNWLSIIKNHSDLEEEHDFEIVDNSCSRGAVKIEILDSKMADLSDFFSHIDKDLKLWVNSSINGTEDSWEERENFFSHIPRGVESWLPKASQQLCSLEDTTDKDFFKHISKQDSTWLRSRAHVKHQAVQIDHKKTTCSEKALKPTNSVDLSRWLVKNNSQIKTEAEDKNVKSTKVVRAQDKWLQRESTIGVVSSSEFQLEEVCRANEPCSSFSECLSQPNCAAFCQQSSAVKNPIDPMTAFKPQQLPLGQWLATPTVTEDDDTTVVRMGCGDCHKQVASNSPSSGVPTSSFKSCKEETNQWLRGNQSSCQEPSSPTSSFDLLSIYSGSSLSDWLVIPTSDTDAKPDNLREQELEKMSSDSWSLCSTSPSLNGDQFIKDVEIAADYINKWVLQ